MWKNGQRPWDRKELDVLKEQKRPLLFRHREQRGSHSKWSLRYRWGKIIEWLIGHSKKSACLVENVFKQSKKRIREPIQKMLLEHITSTWTIVQPGLPYPHVPPIHKATRKLSQNKANHMTTLLKKPSIIQISSKLFSNTTQRKDKKC